MRLALLAEAEAEFDDAATWYDDRSEGLGDEFMDVAREAMMLIVDSAEAVAIVAEGTSPPSAHPPFSVAAVSVRDCVSSPSGPRRCSRDRA